MRWPVACAALALCASSNSWAGLPTFCERHHEIDAAQQDRVLRFAGAVRQELERSGSSVALIARAGVDLSRFGQVYSHAGVALKNNPDSPWAVRQLYYACDDGRAQLFDQGVAGFALGADAPDKGHISLLFVPEPQQWQLEQAALDKPLALSLLGAKYSATAYAFSTRYQNCNGWVAELLASAWGRLDTGAQVDENRARAQQWLRSEGFDAGPVRVPSRWLMFAGQFAPFVSLNDHPEEDLYALALHVSVPSAIERFVQRRLPGTARVELCHDESKIVVRRGWEPLGASCTPGPDDEVIAL